MLPATHLNEKSIYEMWLKLISTCLKSGAAQHDENVELIELLGVSFHIQSPDVNDSQAWESSQKEIIEAMIKNFNSNEPQFGFKFSYGMRIFSPNQDEGYNSVLNILKKKPEAKSATMSLLRAGDHLGSHVPCITTLDFKIRENKLHTYYFARSQDVFKKSAADNIAIMHISLRLAKELGIEVGGISGFIASAHIYHKDQESAQSMTAGRST